LVGLARWAGTAAFSGGMLCMLLFIRCECVDVSALGQVLTRF